MFLEFQGVQLTSLLGSLLVLMSKLPHSHGPGHTIAYLVNLLDGVESESWLGCQKETTVYVCVREVKDNGRRTAYICLYWFLVRKVAQGFFAGLKSVLRFALLEPAAYKEVCDANILDLVKIFISEVSNLTPLHQRYVTTVCWPTGRCM